MTPEELRARMTTVTAAEKIMVELKKGKPLSTTELAKRIGVDTKETVDHILRRFRCDGTVCTTLSKRLFHQTGHSLMGGVKF